MLVWRVGGVAAIWSPEWVELLEGSWSFKKNFYFPFLRKETNFWPCPGPWRELLGLLEEPGTQRFTHSRRVWSSKFLPVGELCCLIGTQVTNTALSLCFICFILMSNWILVFMPSWGLYFFFHESFFVVRKEREGGMGMTGGLSTCLRFLWYVEDFLPRRILCQPYGLSNRLYSLVQWDLFAYIFSHPTSFFSLI